MLYHFHVLSLVMTIIMPQVRQGELSDPLYFDFISFAQYATVCQELARPRQVFKVAPL